MKIIKLLLTLIIFSLLIVVVAKGQSDNSTSSSQVIEDIVYKMKEVDKKPKITKKPKASTRNSYGECEGEGYIHIHAILRKSGIVSDITLAIPSPCMIFDESALKVAKKIKFKPALKNGEPVSVSVILEYYYKVF